MLILPTLAHSRTYNATGRPCLIDDNDNPLINNEFYCFFQFTWISYFRLPEIFNFVYLEFCNLPGLSRIAIFNSIYSHKWDNFHTLCFRENISGGRCSVPTLLGRSEDKYLGLGTILTLSSFIFQIEVGRFPGYIIVHILNKYMFVFYVYLYSY